MERREIRWEWNGGRSVGYGVKIDPLGMEWREIRWEWSEEMSVDWSEEISVGNGTEIDPFKMKWREIRWYWSERTVRNRIRRDPLVTEGRGKMGEREKGRG